MGFQENLNSLVQAINNRAKLSDIEPIGDLIANSSSHVPLSGVTSYHLLSGNLALANSVITNGFATTLYTGNGATQDVVTGVDMATQWGNSATETFGGLVWGKSRNVVGNNILFDTVRGVNNRLQSDTTLSQNTVADTLTSFNNNGFTVGSAAGYLNVNTTTYASWVFQTTHRITGTTNHGKAYTCHYNPFTGFTIVKYEGSGIAGHEIPHHLGRKLGFISIKNLTTAVDWHTGTETLIGNINATGALVSASPYWTIVDNQLNLNSSSSANNASTNQYIMYGWANSYFDEANTLIGNYEIGIYQGTGAAGNKVTTRGKPAWVMIKRLDAAGHWIILDNKRDVDSASDTYIFANLSNAEEVNNTSRGGIAIKSDGFTNLGVYVEENASGGRYLYMVVYDNDSGSGKSKYPRATDTSTLNLNATIPFANGLDANGAKNSILTKNETVAGLTLTQGKNYVYSKNDGTYGVTPHAPQYASLKARAYATEAPEFFDVLTNKWYTTTGHGELVTNGTFDTNASGWTAYNGATLSSASGGLFMQWGLTDYPGAYQAITTVVGEKYTVEWYGSNSDIGIVICSAPDWNTASNRVLICPRNVKTEFVAEQTTYYVFINVYVTTDNSSTRALDVISIYKSMPTVGPEITESRNYLDAIVYADAGGQPTYVEQLPKTEYKDVVKANEYQGKNACTAWVNFDGTTTPPTIRDSYNVKSVVRINTGMYEVYFDTPMVNTNYTFSVSGAESVIREYYVRNTSYLGLSKIIVECGDLGFTQGINPTTYVVQIFGGKN